MDCLIKKIYSSVFRLKSDISETESEDLHWKSGSESRIFCNKHKNKQGYKLISEEETKIEKC